MAVRAPLFFSFFCLLVVAALPPVVHGVRPKEAVRSFADTVAKAAKGLHSRFDTTPASSSSSSLPLSSRIPTCRNNMSEDFITLPQCPPPTPAPALSAIPLLEAILEHQRQSEGGSPLSSSQLSTANLTLAEVSQLFAAFSEYIFYSQHLLAQTTDFTIDLMTIATTFAVCAALFLFWQINPRIRAFLRYHRHAGLPMYKDKASIAEMLNHIDHLLQRIIARMEEDNRQTNQPRKSSSSRKAPSSPSTTATQAAHIRSARDLASTTVLDTAESAMPSRGIPSPRQESLRPRRASAASASVATPQRARRREAERLSPADVPSQQSGMLLRSGLTPRRHTARREAS